MGQIDHVDTGTVGHKMLSGRPVHLIEMPLGDGHQILAGLHDQRHLSSGQKIEST